MAKKGQKFNSYPKEIKEEILRRYHEEQISSSVLGKEFGISENTIRNWVHKTKSGRDILIDHRQYSSGRPRKNSDEIDYKERYEILKKYQAFLKARREKR